MKSFLGLIRHIYRYREMIFLLARRQLQERYVGTLGGMSWTLLQPLALVLVYWLVFSKGLKIQPTGGQPFVIVFVCGLVPWLFFAEVLGSSTVAVVNNPSFVKKVVFPTEVLPIISLLAAFFGHMVMMGILFVLLLFYGNWPSAHAVQVVWFSGALSLLAIGFGWLLSALNVFVRDISQLLTIALNLWFWLTPIVWPIEMLPEGYRTMAMLNPLYYITEGYKKALIDHQWSAFSLWPGLYFWAICLFVLFAGAYTFRRLKDDFADVL